ncbi:MAG: hypothetical protein GY696_16115 [Gammaproteobacteria bacterium]|nr:hypothetical protein [Gammaproteobacteria bacterium]
MENILGNGQRYLVPEVLKDEVFQACHELATAGHFGGNSTIARAFRDEY